MVFTSNRGEKTVGVFHHGRDQSIQKIAVGGRPNGLAFDSSRHVLLAANVAIPDTKEPITVSIVDLHKRVMTADITVPGRTRWTVYDPVRGRFYVNIADPSQIAIFETKDPDEQAGSYHIPAKGPHGLDLDENKGRLFCACDEGRLFGINLRSGKVSLPSNLAGAPDVIFYNPKLDHLYVAIDDPSVIQVFDTQTMREIQTVPTEHGTHTIAFDQNQNKVYAFMPETHRAAVYKDA